MPELCNGHTELGTTETLGLWPEPALGGEQVPSFSGQALSLQAKSGEEPAVPTGQQGCSSGLWLTLPAVPRPLTQSLCTGCPHIPSPQHKGGTHAQGNPGTSPFSHYFTQITRFCLQFLELQGERRQERAAEVGYSNSRLHQACSGKQKSL